jgi:hypothetical protein
MPAVPPQQVASPQSRFPEHAPLPAAHPWDLFLDPLLPPQ